MVSMKAASFSVSSFQLITAGTCSLRHDDVFHDGHVLDQREMLVDHAQAHGMGMAGLLDLDRHRRRGRNPCRLDKRP